MDLESKIYAQFHSIRNKSYQDVWDFQTLLHENVKAGKKSTASKGKRSVLNHIVFCEHLPVFTLGKSAKEENLRLDKAGYLQKGFELFPINRGGDVTYHGPGQLTGYFIIDLELLYRDVHRYVRNLEEVIINVLKSYNLEGQRLEGHTGVWLMDKDKKQFRKICAIGVHLSRWVSMHGIGFNVNSDLSHFEHIIPCGIADKNKTVTSLAKELGQDVSMREVQKKVLKELGLVFGIEIIND